MPGRRYARAGGRFCWSTPHSCTTSFTARSDSSLVAIFRWVQLLLCTQSLTRDLWHEAIRNSCSVLPLAASSVSWGISHSMYFVKGRWPLTTADTVFSVVIGVGRLMQLDHKSGASGAAAMSQHLVTMPPESNTSSTFVVSCSPTAPCVPGRQLRTQHYSWQTTIVVCLFFSIKVTLCLFIQGQKILSYYIYLSWSRTIAWLQSLKKKKKPGTELLGSFMREYLWHGH